MSGETIALIVSLVLNAAIALSTIIANIYISRLSNLKSIGEYKKHITIEYLEYLVRCENWNWFVETIDKNYIQNYDWISQRRIIRYRRKYKKQILQREYDLNKISQAMRDAG